MPQIYYVSARSRLKYPQKVMKTQVDNIIKKMVISLLVSSLAVASGLAKNLEKTKTDITSSANPSTYGQWVTLTATVTATGGTPTGTVTFKSGNTILCVATLNSQGQAAFSTNLLGKVGTAHPISADYAGDASFKGSSANGFKQEIVPATLTVAGLSAKNKLYDTTTGATLDTSKAVLVGVVAGDAVALDVGSANGAFANKNAGKNKNVSVSGIILSGADAANYVLAVAEAAADIVPATLTVTAANQSRAHGADNPPLTASYSGFVNSETLATSDVTGSPSLVTSATTDSAAGSYPIVAAAGTLASVNYNFVFVNGALTVTGSAITPAEPVSLALQPQAAGGMKVNLSSGANQTCVIEASTDLVHWTAISTNSTDAAGQSTFVDPDAKNYPARFYRGVAAAQ
jgi:hypothetical protein